MKYLLLLLLMFTFYSAKSQVTDSSKALKELKTEKDASRIVFTKTEVAPSYPEGEEKLNSYIGTNFKIENIMPGAKGDYTVTIRFIVRLDGTSYDFVPETKNGYGIEEEMIRILKSISLWNAAKQNNRNVYCYFRQTMTAHL